ncbi:MAG: hypothetical protein IJX33_01455 [Akkermansia sp.]|nr:hypothetical protein [Akkermansia sp.]MBQ8375703.1 hypothetical protein [Akkermansia sp.]
MSTPPVPAALKFWRNFFAVAVLLVFLATVFWQVDALLGYPVLTHTREEDRFLLTIIVLLPFVSSVWLQLRFFPPRRSSNEERYLLRWFLMNAVVSFLTGAVLMLVDGLPEYTWESRLILILEIGLMLAVATFALGLVLAFPLYLIFKKIRDSV